jgi:hypothetical protein
MALDVAKIEEKIDRVAAGAMTVSDAVGGVHFQNMSELMEFAKLMSIAGSAVPAHCRGEPGVCLAICIQALEWRMSPFAVANKSYVVENRGDKRIAYESQLIHAVIEARAPLRGRLRFEIVGENDERRCKVWGLFRGEDKPHEYTSETLGKLRGARGTNDRGHIKGSPLWVDNPEVQLFYSGSRQWARLYCPDVILGVYTREELEETGGTVRDVTPPPRPKLAERLRSRARPSATARGFDHAHVEREIGGNAKGGAKVVEGRAEPVAPAPQEVPQGDPAQEPPPGAEPEHGDEPAAGQEQAQGALTVIDKKPPKGVSEAEATQLPDPLELARQRGRAARRSGVARRAIPRNIAARRGGQRPTRGSPDGMTQSTRPPREGHS